MRIFEAGRMRPGICLLGLLAALAAGRSWARPDLQSHDPRERAVAALAKAACEGRATLVAADVRGGADPNGTYSIVLPTDDRPMVWSPLIEAVSCGKLSGVKALLDAGADPNRAVDGDTPMTAASERVGKAGPEILTALLARGGDPNAHDARRTALELALIAGSGQEYRGEAPKQAWANWQALLDAGADVNRRDPSGQDIMFFATQQTRYDKVGQVLALGYTGDLVELGRSVTMSMSLWDRTPRATIKTQGPWLEQVKVYLRDHQVKLPVPPLVQLKKGADGRYIQP